MIDHIFNHYSWIQKRKFYLFFIFYLVPFCLQIVTDFWTPVKAACLVSCLLVQTYLVLIEYIQLRARSRAYLQNPYNWVDMAFAVFSFYYIIERLKDPSKKISILDLKDEDGLPLNEQVFWMILSSTLIFFSCFKMMEFLRVFKEFGMLI